jgi:glycosidase
MPTLVKPVIYQLIVRTFGNTNTTNQRNGTLAVNGCGRFADITTKALAGLASFGVTHVWLTGCLRQATLTDYSAQGMPADDPDVVKGIAGSMYAVRDYFDVCPDYATVPGQRMAEFDALVRRVQEAGLKVLLDFVPNHVARGYHSVVEPQLDFGLGDDQSKFFDRDNHFFYLPGTKLSLTHYAGWNPPGVVFDGKFAPEDGGPGRTPKVTGDNCASASPSESNWYETVKLDYGFDFTNGTKDFTPRPRTWTLMDQILAYWQDKGADGFRCDMAHYVPREAWDYLILKAKDRDPECFFLAEAYAGGGSDIPIANLDDLLAAGFSAYYHSDAYNALKRIYQGKGSQDDYDKTITSLSASGRAGRLGYLENHDERRIASAIEPDQGTGDSGFGAAEAGYQLAPLQLLFGGGPVLFFNGQEVGEPGAGAEGFSSGDGRTTTFDYWCMPEFARWVNKHNYDGGKLSQKQKDLRHFYADLLALCQDASIRGDGYWGLKYHNRSSEFGACPDDLYTFARFQGSSGRLVLVVANFRPNATVSGQVGIPQALADVVDLPANVTVRLVLDRTGAKNVTVAQQTRQSLVEGGFPVSVPNQTAQVYVVG